MDLLRFYRHNNIVLANDFDIVDMVFLLYMQNNYRKYLAMLGYLIGTL